MAHAIEAHSGDARRMENNGIVPVPERQKHRMVGRAESYSVSSAPAEIAAEPSFTRHGTSPVPRELLSMAMFKKASQSFREFFADDPL